jgi:hypothetical protein
MLPFRAIQYFLIESRAAPAAQLLLHMLRLLPMASTLHMLHMLLAVYIDEHTERTIRFQL